MAARTGMVGGLLASVVVRYALVGVLIAAVYWLLANVLVLIVPVAPPWLSAGAAFLIAVSLQYVLHARFTFGNKAADAGQAARFATAVAAGLAISSAITGLAGPAMGWPHVVNTAVVVVVVPVSNFLLFRAWVFVKAGAGGLTGGG